MFTLSKTDFGVSTLTINTSPNSESKAVLLSGVCSLFGDVFIVSGLLIFGNVGP